MRKTLRGVWHDGERWFDARTLRERAMLACAAVAVLIGGWTAMWFDPASAARDALREEIEALELERSEIVIQQNEVLARHREDPNEILRARREALRLEIAASDERIREYTAGLIGPQEMAGLLESMLRTSTELEFLRLEHLGAEPLQPRKDTEGEPDTETGLFVHRMELVFRGTYLAALDTLHDLEALEGQFFWDGLEYEVDEHPDGIARLRTFTLSSEEDWIGA